MEEDNGFIDLCYLFKKLFIFNLKDRLCSTSAFVFCFIDEQKPELVNSVLVIEKLMKV